MSGVAYDLTRFELFAGLEGRPLKQLQENHRILSAPARQTLVSQGDFAPDFFLVLRGMVSAIRTAPDGARTRLATLGHGDWFGELSALSNQPFQAELVSDAPSVLAVIDAATFRAIYAKNAAFRARIDARYRKWGLLVQLRLAPLFRGLAPEELGRLRDEVRFEVFEEGETLARLGEPAGAVYLVRSGAVACIRVEPTGARLIQSYYSSNSSFGERCLADGDDRRWPADIVALARTDVLVVPRETMLATFRGEQTLELLRTATARIVAEEKGDITGFFDSDGAVAARGGDGGSIGGEEERELMVRRQSVKGGEALVIDLWRCTRCNACVESCVAVHEDGIPRLSKMGNRISAELCMTTSCYNCAIPECMMACDHGAIRRDQNGLIRFVFDNCVGCSDCMNACPYDVIRMTPPPAPKPPEPEGAYSLLRRLPGIGAWFGRRCSPEEPAKPAKVAGGKAIKCDLCAGLPFEACVYNCPCSAIKRVPVDEIWDREDVRVRSPRIDRS
jgi:CRP-like cAMP-binding protein/Fe-S-cluster-containing dehydrogenase component